MISGGATVKQQFVFPSILAEDYSFCDQDFSITEYNKLDGQDSDQYYQSNLCYIEYKSDGSKKVVGVMIKVITVTPVILTQA